MSEARPVRADFLKRLSVHRGSTKARGVLRPLPHRLLSSLSMNYCRRFSWITVAVAVLVATATAVAVEHRCMLVFASAIAVLVRFSIFWELFTLERVKSWFWQSLSSAVARQPLTEPGPVGGCLP